jgi:hypothetical protein
MSDIVFLRVNLEAMAKDEFTSMWSRGVIRASWRPGSIREIELINNSIDKIMADEFIARAKTKKEAIKNGNY